MKKMSKKTLLCVPMYLWAILFVSLPLTYIVGISFLERDPVWGMSSITTLANYKKLFEPQTLRVFGSSMVTSGIASAVALVVGYPFAYFMAKLSPKRRALVMVLVVVPFWTSALIRTYGWMTLLRADGPINTLLKNLGVIKRPLKMLYSQGAVYLAFVYTMLPFMILPCFTAIERMDFVAVEAARDLGAGPVRAFCTVTLPLTAPGIMTGLTLTFVPGMGLFFLSDLMGGSKTMLVGNLISDQMLGARNQPFGAALAVAMLLMTAFVLWLQRRAGGEVSLF